MAPSLVQSAVNTVRKCGAGDRGSVFLKSTLSQPTTPGSLILVVAFITGGVDMPVNLSNSTFTRIVNKSLRDTQMVVWYKQGASSITSLTVTVDAYRGALLRIYEYAGVAQSGALDKVTVSAGENSSPNSGSTSTLGASGELVFAAIGNQYTATQSGFTGGFSRIYESVIPDGSREEWERGRLTAHQLIATDTSARRLTASLSTTRRWVSFCASFKSGTIGPARFTVTKATKAIAADRSKALLTVFGPLKVTLSATRTALQPLTAVKARIGPYDYQYRLGGWGGLLIGAGTPYPIESIEGLEGWAIRTSDDDQPREDGSLRGVDLQAARQILIKLGAPSAAGSRSQVEAQLSALYNALVPRRDTDAELIWRHPGRPLRTLYYRPTDLLRGMSLEEVLTGKQAFALRAADPRHYAAVVRTVTVPVASDDTETVNVVAANNLGNARAYPIIRVVGPLSGADVTRVALFNASANVSFEVDAVIQQKAELIGDMRAKIAGTGGLVISLNGASKYGAWQMPREPFYLAPAPTVDQGVNLLYARTVPTGASVSVTIEYRDCWSG